MLALLVLSLLALPGCASSGATVTGTLVLPSNVKLNDTDSVTISFVPAEGSGTAYPATFSAADKSFVAHGPSKKGVPPGKYKVAVQLQTYTTKDISEERSEMFAKINNAYGPAQTKLTYEVTGGSRQAITIDLVKGTVAKQ